MLSVFFAAALAAQTVPATEPPIAAPPAPPIALSDCCVIKALTPVRLAITNPINSNATASGQSFAITLSSPILLDGGRSIPAGTTGQGEVIHAARSGMAGKAGELVLAARYLDYHGIRIPLRSMRFGGAGKDQTGLAFAATTAIGLIGMVITGGEVRVLAGAPADAKISTDIRIDPALLAAPTIPPSSSSTSEGNVQ